MSKKMCRSVLFLMVMLQVLNCVLQINGMRHHTFEEIPPEKLSSAIVEELKRPAPVMSKEAAEMLKKEILDAKKEAIKTVKIQKLKEELKKRNDGEGEVFVYNKKTTQGYIFGENAVSLSDVLSGLLFGNDNKSMVFPVATSPEGIKTLLHILEGYKACLTKKSSEKEGNEVFLDCNKTLAEEMKEIDFGNILSTFVLASNLGVTHNNTQGIKDISQIISEEIQRRLLSVQGNLTLETSKDFNLLRLLTSDEKQAIFTDKNRNVIKNRIVSTFFNYGFNVQPIHYSTSPLIKKINYVSFNEDSSCLLYTGVRENNLFCKYLFEINLKSDDLSLNRRPKIIAPNHFPCWINKSVFTYIESDGTANSRNNRLIVYDRISKENIRARTIFPDYTEEYKNFKILDMLYGNEKIVLLYHYGVNNGIGVFNTTSGEKEAVTYKRLNFANAIKLLPVKNNSVFILEYDDEYNENQQISLYEAPITYDLSTKKFDVSDFKLSWKTSIKYTKDQFSDGVLNKDGSKMAFIVNDNIFIQSLENFDLEPVKCSGVTDIFSVVFSSDNTMLMVGCGGGKIIFFDVKTGEKISELLSRDNKAFDSNDCIAFSPDGMMFCVGGDKKELLIMKLQSDWQKKRDRYLSLLNELEQSSFDKIILLNVFDNRSAHGEKPVILTDAEKIAFQGFDLEIQQLFTDIGYIAPGQVGEKFVKQEKSAEQPEIPTIVPQKQQSRWEWFWSALMKYFPQSG